jgi:carbon storage regulator
MGRRDGLPNDLVVARDRRAGAKLVSMLVLTRKNGQSIMLGDDVEITVISNDGTKVRLGIQAPADVSIHRSEIYREIQTRGRNGAGSERHERELPRAHRQAG